MSAIRVCSPMSRVRVWQMVTVALARSLRWASMIASGIPTRSPRPTTHTFAPAIGVCDRTRSSTIPNGVAGRKTGCPRDRNPTLVGLSPSTSFAVSMACWTANSET
jgi:hypothetical protein